MVISHNLAAMNTANCLGKVSKSFSKSTEKLSSGYKINRASDDAAGLTISEKMRYQIRGLNKASNNIQDGISYVQVADGALDEVTSIIQRMRELSVQGANDTNTDTDRQAIQDELDTLKKETDRIFTDTTFNTMPVFARKLDYVQYEDKTQQIVTDTGTKYVEGNNYGLIEVLGKDKITTDSHLSDSVTLDKDGTWVTSGNREPKYEENIGSAGTDYGTAYAWKLFQDNGDGTYTHTGTGDVWTKSSQYSNYFELTKNDDSGNTETLGYETNKHTTYLSDYTKTDATGKITADAYYPFFDGVTYLDGVTYPCAKIDFSGLGTDYTKDDLYGLGFSSVCQHGCGAYYSIKFVDGTKGNETFDKTTDNGIKYNEKSSKSYVITMDISGISDDAAGAQKLVEAVVQAAKNSTDFDDHWGVRTFF